MKVIFVCHRIPYPPNKGDKIRSYNLLKYLSRHHDVYLFCLIDDSKDIEHVAPVRTLVKDVFFDVINPGLKKITGSAALLKGRPISTRYFYSTKLQNELDDLLDRKPADLIFCFCSPTAEYVFHSRHYRKGLRGVARVMDLVDVDSEKWRDYAARTRWPLSLIYSMEARYLARYEARIAEEFDRIFLVSEPEKALFLQKNKANNVTALSNGVDLDHFSPDYKPQIEGKSPALVFTGAMDYWPNIDGVVWFATEVFPKIREEFPTATFFIVGGNPAPDVKSLSRIDGVKVTGFVKDVRDYIAIADACVVPLRIARGIQNKVLEAMAMGKPVVTTSRAAEGISAEPGREFLLADRRDEFISAVKRILSDGALCSTLSACARQLVERDYRWERRLAKLDKFLGKQKYH